MAHTLTLQCVSWTEIHFHAACIDKQISLQMRSVGAKTIPRPRRYNLQMLICVAPLSISKEKKQGSNKEGAQYISRMYNFNIPTLKAGVLHAGIVPICSLCKLQPIRNAGPENKNLSHKSDLTGTVLNTLLDIFPKRNACVCVCACWGEWEE